LGEHATVSIREAVMCKKNLLGVSRHAVKHRRHEWVVDDSDIVLEARSKLSNSSNRLLPAPIVDMDV